MSQKLMLLPFESIDPQSNNPHSLTVLPCPNVSGILEFIQEIEQERGRPVPEKFASFCSHDGRGDWFYGDTTQTRFGHPLLYVLAEEIGYVFTDGSLSGYFNEVNRKLPVALYWY